VSSEATPSAGAALFQELLWVHRMVRRDLERVRELATAAANGDASSAEIRDEVEALKTNGPLWKLKVNCLRYCAFVHSHHNAEDVMLFPALRAANPDLDPIVDRLEADHRRVSDLLDTVEASAGDLNDNAGNDARERVATALDELAEHLLEHLDFEEESVAETMRSPAFGTRPMG
jgi:iron-sulfur cluster repair protein YtfE (RIC family)